MKLIPPESSSSFPLAVGDSSASRHSTSLEAEVVQFFDELRTPVLRYVLSMGLQLDDAEEVVQEVFLALFRHLRVGKPRTNLKAWVFRVGHNLSLRHRIRNGRRERLQCPDEAAEGLLHPQRNPEEEFAAGQRRKRLMSVISELNEVDRCCLNLRAEGLRYREIASVLEISLGGVSLSLSRALNRLSIVDKEHA